MVVNGRNIEAAWAPFPPGGRASHREALTWVTSRCSGRNGLLVTHLKRGLAPDLRRFADTHAHWTSKGRTERRTGGSGPTLCCWPDRQVLSDAMARAHGSALCVVEWPSFSLRGWASYLGAVEVTTGEETAPYGEEIVELIDDVARQSYNGFAKELDLQLAEPSLLGLQGQVDRRDLEGALIAAGVYPRAYATLEERLLKRVWPAS